MRPRALRLTRAVVASLLCLVPLASRAQTQAKSTAIYRCGPEGRELRELPCGADPAASRALVPYDEPSKAQRDAAAQRARAEGRSADAMESARLKREADERKHAPAAIGIHGRGQPPAPAASAGKTGDKKQPKAPKSPSAPKSPKTPQAPSLPTSKPARAASA